MGEAGRMVCPDLSGTYLDAAQESTGCSDRDALACNSLSFHLFSRHVREADGVSNLATPVDDWPVATHLKIEQPEPNRLRIVALGRGTGSQPMALASRELDRRRGDFSCNADVVRLKPRVEREYLLLGLWGRGTRTEFMEWSADPQALTVQSMRQHDSYFFGVVGGTMRVETSRVRWARAM